MATKQQKAFCVLEFGRTQSIITVQRAFRQQYGINPPSDNNIRRWFHQFRDTGCLCKGKSTGRPRTASSAENVAAVQAAFTRSPSKSVRRASNELRMSSTSVWRVLRRRLVMKPYRLQLVQALRRGDKTRRLEFATTILQTLDTDEHFCSRINFSDEATFHLSGKVNRHNVRIWGLENPHATLEHERDSPKVNVFCALSRRKLYGPFFFEGNTVTGASYLQMLQDWLFPQLQEDKQEDFIFQQDGAPPHWSLAVRHFLNETLPQRWIGRSGDRDLSLLHWPPRSPDITPCDFFVITLLW